MQKFNHFSYNEQNIGQEDANNYKVMATKMKTFGKILVVKIKHQCGVGSGYFRNTFSKEAGFKTPEDFEAGVLPWRKCLGKTRLIQPYANLLEVLEYQ